MYVSHPIPVADLPCYSVLSNISNVVTRILSLRLHGWLLYLGLASRPLNPSSGRGSVYCGASIARTAFMHMSLSARIRILQAGWKMSPTSLTKAGGSGLRPRRCVDATVWRSSGSPQSGTGSRRDPACRSCTSRRIRLVGER